MSVPSNTDVTVQVNDNDDNVTGQTSSIKQDTQATPFSTYKNVFVISLAFLLLFTAHDGIKNLQSSLNTDGNIGVNCLSVIHGCFVLSAVFVLHSMIALFGLKWTLAISQVPFLLYVAANYYPKAYLMYPAAVLVGFTSASLWTSAFGYITELACDYAPTINAAKDAIASRFIGIFYMIYYTAQVWGNLISFLLLVPQQNNTIYEAPTKSSSHYSKCGADFSEQEYDRIIPVPPVNRTTVNILCVIYICICVCSILAVTIFLDHRRAKSQDQNSLSTRRFVGLFISTIKQLRSSTQLLLIPLTVWSGLEQSFLSALFTKAFVTCATNPKYVGLVFVVFGVSTSVGSLVVGRCTEIIGRWPFFVLAALINYTLIVVMFVWQPTEDDMAILCVVAGFWGVSEAIWLTQITVLYGVLFPDNNEAAFSNYCLWDALGFLLFYVMMPYVRTRAALIVMLIFLSLGMCGYGVIKYRWHTQQRKLDEDHMSKIVL